MRAPVWPLSPVNAAAHASALFLPAAGSVAVLPALDAAYHASSTANGSTDFALLLALLLGKRVCLYTTAAAAVAVGALRSSGSEPESGERLKSLTREIYGSSAATSLESPDGDGAVEALNSLDESPALAQAVALPLVFSLLLLGSFVLLPSLDAGTPAGAGALGFASTGLEALRGAAAVFGPFSNAAICLVFCRAELTAMLGAAFPGDQASADAEPQAAPAVAAAATALAGLATAAAFGLPAAVAWPVQNVVNICIATSVARLLALGRLSPILLALAALATYDIAFAGGAASAATLPAADAAAAISAASPAASMAGSASSAASVADFSAQSVMESVARSRLSAQGAWQPGLLQVLQYIYIYIYTHIYIYIYIYI